MFKLKPVLIFSFVLLVSISCFYLWKVKEKQDYSQKVILAQEIRKVMNYLMFDLREARQGSIENVPKDGRWHDRVAFRHGASTVEYVLSDGQISRISSGRKEMIAQYISALRMRRQPADVAVVEVEIRARNKVTLTSNFKIRMQD